MPTRLRPGKLLVVLSLFALLTASACAPKTMSRTLDDATISTRVKTALLNDADIGAMRIDVTTLNTVVTLSGTVRTEADRERAVALARKVNGVSAVKTALQVQ